MRLRFPHAEPYTNCRNCQVALENFLIEFPYCQPEEIDEKHREVWEACPSCRAEYVEVLKSEYCQHDNPAHLCTLYLDEWADENAPDEFNTVDQPSDWERQNIEVPHAS